MLLLLTFCRIRITHDQFQRRAVNFGGLGPRDKTPYLPPHNSEYMVDYNGHGTHVAGTIGGYQFGVAPYAKLINVKAFNQRQSGWAEFVADAINDIVHEFVENKKKYQGKVDWYFRGGIINMSFGWKGTDDGIQAAAKRAHDAGMLLIASAGNHGDSGGNWLPCNLEGVHCVGSVNADYTMSDFSNYGSKVEFLAPGDLIKSAGRDKDWEVAIKSGTSMAAPHVAGVAAIYTSWLGLTSAQQFSYLWSNARDGFISGNLKGSHNHLVDTGIHAPEKFASEPFRRAYEQPSRDHDYEEFTANIDDPVPTATDPYIEQTGDVITGIDSFPWLTLQAPPAGETTDTAVNEMDTSAWFLETETATSTAGPAATSKPGGSAGQQMALATYIDPGANPDVWDRLIAFPSDKVSILVANVVNGPDSSINAGWKDVLPRATASGKTVLGYVRTGYLGVSFQKFTTRLGSSKTSDWVAQIQEDVDQWYRLYPDQIGGIFFDEAWNVCGEDNVNAKLYEFITQSTKRKYPGAFTVLNPGSPMPQCFEYSADTLLTYESDYETYTGSGYVGNTWTPKDPRKIWHIIHTVPAGQAAAVAKLALSRGVGLVEITDDVMPNPYDTLSSDSYMQTLMDAMEGGTPLNEGLYGWPAASDNRGSAVTPHFNLYKYDYSSATFVWTVSNDQAAGFRVYQDSVLALELPPSSDSVTVGGLEPDTLYRFAIASIYQDGSSAPKSQTVLVHTKPLPGSGHTVSSSSVSATGSQTIYKARILVPYAFVRVFIFDGDCHLVPECLTCPTHFGWPINYQQWSAVCNQYMIEGGTLYSYSGKQDSKTGNMPWSWKWQAEVQIVQDGYDWTWTVPMGSDTIDVKKYMVQVQGYGPRANAYGHCPVNRSLGTKVKHGDYCL